MGEHRPFCQVEAGPRRSDFNPREKSQIVKPVSGKPIRRLEDWALLDDGPGAWLTISWTRPPIVGIALRFSRPEFQYEFAEITSLLDLVPSAHQTLIAIVLLIAWTDPSAKTTLTTPGCRLDADAMKP